MTTYIGTRGLTCLSTFAHIWRKAADGEQTPLRLRRDLRDHSTEFEWNYGGSGPAQSALALLADATGDDQWALTHYQQFKWDVVAKLPREWELPQETVLEWVAEQKRKDEAEGHWVRTGEPDVP